MKIGRICVLICGIQLFVGINNLFGCLKSGIRFHISHCLISASSIQLVVKHVLPELLPKLEAQHIFSEQAKNQSLKPQVRKHVAGQVPSSTFLRKQRINDIKIEKLEADVHNSLELAFKDEAYSHFLADQRIEKLGSKHNFLTKREIKKTNHLSDSRDVKLDTTKIVLSAPDNEKLEKTRQCFSIKQKLFYLEPAINCKIEATTQIMLKLIIEKLKAENIAQELNQELDGVNFQESKHHSILMISLKSHTKTCSQK